MEIDAVYRERNQVVAALAKCFPSGLKKTAIEGWDEAWHNCVYIDLPTGQASWHFHDDDAPLFEGLPAYHGEWDGHSTPEKYARLHHLTTAPSDGKAATAEPGEGEEQKYGFLNAYVSEDAHEVGIWHERGADWQKIRAAHIALRDRINERLEQEDLCPHKSPSQATHALVHPAPPSAQPSKELVDELRSRAEWHRKSGMKYDMVLYFKASRAAEAALAQPSSPPTALIQEIASYLESRPGDAHADKLLRRSMEALAQAPVTDAGKVEDVPWDKRPAHPLAAWKSGLKLGLHRIHWKSGGNSLAAIGMMSDGRRWIAPCNWISPSVEPTSGSWGDIDRTELLFAYPEMDEEARTEATEEKPLPASEGDEA